MKFWGTSYIRDFVTWRRVAPRKVAAGKLKHTSWQQFPHATKVTGRSGFRISAFFLVWSRSVTTGFRNCSHELRKIEQSLKFIDHFIPHWSSWWCWTFIGGNYQRPLGGGMDRVVLVIQSQAFAKILTLKNSVIFKSEKNQPDNLRRQRIISKRDNPSRLITVRLCRFVSE